MKDLSDSFVKCYEARTCHDLLGVILGESCASRNKDIAWNGMSHVGMSTFMNYSKSTDAACRYLRQKWPCASKTDSAKD